MTELPESWREWRATVDRRLDEHGNGIAETKTEIAILKTRQQISIDNEAARHARTPQLVISIVSVSLSVLFFVLQLLAARGGTP